MAPGRAATSALAAAAFGTWIGALTPLFALWSIQYSSTCSSLIRSTCFENQRRPDPCGVKSIGSTSAPQGQRDTLRRNKKAIFERFNESNWFDRLTIKTN